MPRKLRTWFPGAVYHITCRGNRRQNIYLNAQDKQVFLNYLLEVKQKCKFEVLTYCLMDNHYHLQLETSTIEISRIMQLLNTRYAIYFNKRYELVGHLFQGRYGSEIIDSHTYMLDVSRYIHLNPVRAGIFRSPGDYVWSSYLNYLGVKNDALVNTERILSYFDGHDSLAYCEFVEAGSDP